MAAQDPTHQRRRPRVHFDPSLARTYEMGMIQQGWETLAAIHQFRWLTSWQVAKLLFLGRPNLAGVVRGREAARKAANERCLRRLKDRQLVETRQAMLTHGTSYRRQEYTVLTKTGHLLLRDYLTTRGVSPPEWDPDRFEIAPEALPHALALTDVAIALSRSCEHHGGRLLAWIDDFDHRVKVGQLSLDGLVPDATALIEVHGTPARSFIELDRGTEPVASDAPNSWRTKMMRYRAYLSERYAREAFFAGQPQPRLVTVTTSLQRLEHLMAETITCGPSAQAWFALSEWMEPPFDALGEIWLRPSGGDNFFSLLDHLALGSD